jgi:hypothetical protein
LVVLLHPDTNASVANAETNDFMKTSIGTLWNNAACSKWRGTVRRQVFTTWRAAA